MCVYKVHQFYAFCSKKKKFIRNLFFCELRTQKGLHKGHKRTLRITEQYYLYGKDNKFWKWTYHFYILYITSNQIKYFCIGSQFLNLIMNIYCYHLQPRLFRWSPPEHQINLPTLYIPESQMVCLFPSQLCVSCLSKQFSYSFKNTFFIYLNVSINTDHQATVRLPCKTRIEWFLTYLCQKE